MQSIFLKSMQKQSVLGAGRNSTLLLALIAMLSVLAVDPSTDDDLSCETVTVVVEVTEAYARGRFRGLFQE